MNRSFVLLASLAATRAAADDHFQSADDQQSTETLEQKAPDSSRIPTDPDGTPRLDELRVTGEILAGAATGFVGLLGGALVGANVHGKVSPCNSSFCEGTGILTGAGVGLIASVPIGVYLAGSYGTQTGSYGATLLGGLVGVVPGAGMLALGAHTDSEALFAVGVGLTLGGPLVGSIIGFNMTRRYEDGHGPKAPRIAPIVGPSSFGIAGTF